MKTALVATGEKWIGYGTRSFSSVISELMKNAKIELVMTIYVISDMNVIELIKSSLDRGIRVEIFIYLPDPRVDNLATQELDLMEKKYNYLKIHAIRTNVLHAKILVVDGKKVLIGSANPTYGGMVSNYEMGLLVEDGRTASNVLGLLRRLTTQ